MKLNGFKAGRTADYINNKLDVKLLRDTFLYDSGELFWLIPPLNHLNLINKSAGSLTPKGYVKIQFLGKPYKRHQLVWFYHYGRFPSPVCDHINRKRGDDRIENLREVTITENARNHSKISVRSMPSGRFQARLSQRVIGTFDTFEQAKKAYINERRISWSQ